MKQKDIALIVVIVVISGIVSYFVSHIFIGTSKNRNQQVEVVEAINDSFPTPSNKYFNDKSRDFTKLIKISTNSQKDPFNN